MSQPIIIITGANGQLGSECLDASAREPQWNIIGISREELDLEQVDTIHRVLDDYKPDIIVNCAAYTAVDLAELEVEKANLVNGIAPGYLAEWCNDNDALLIHISTDYVFNGDSQEAYTETAQTNPINNYGRSKLLGETKIKSEDKNAVILRTSWVYSEYGKNFIKTMLRLAKERTEVKVVSDQIGTPTYAHDLAEGIFNIIRKYIAHDYDKVAVKGTFHFTNQGRTTWYDFAKKIFELEESTCKAIPISTQEFPTPAKRPKFSVLDTNKYCQSFEWTIPDWEDGLRRCLRNMSME